MAVGGGAGIDRLVEAEVRADAARAQVHHFAETLFEPGEVAFFRAVAVGIDRQRLGDADGVGELDDAAICQARGDNVLREIAGGIGGRAIDLGRVLAGEGAAAMGRCAAIGVDNDLAAGEAAIAVGPADDELARRVDVPDAVLRDRQRVAQRLADVGLDDPADVVGGLLLVGVLGRQDDGDGFLRLAVLVADRDLGFCVRRQRRFLSAVARVSQELQDLVAELDRRRHQLGRLVRGVAEHDALVACALFLVARAVDALGDVL